MSWTFGSKRSAVLVPFAHAALALAAQAQSTCFELPFRTTAGDMAETIESGDLDGDGDADVAISTNNGVQAFFNDGLGGFPASVVLGAPTTALALADLDGDGLLDVVMGDVNAALVRLNLGSGVFAAPSSIPLTRTPESVCAADLDGDGDVDLAAGAASGATLAVALNLGGGSFGAPTSYGPAGSAQSIAAGDLDGDGDVDLVAVGWGSRVLSNQGSGSFVPGASIAWSGQLFDVALGDLDGDGDLDLVASDLWSERVVIALNPGNGVFASTVIRYWDSMPDGIVLADMDEDGALDILAGYENSSSISYSRNLGGGTFGTTYVSLFSGTWPDTLTVADFDGDGDRDIAALNYGSTFFSLIRSCRTSGVIACLGDGSGTACPCANDSAPGAGEGCLNSLGLGGRLRGSGGAKFTFDTLVLRADGMPANTTALFYQGTLLENGGAGLAFQDGLSCAGGSVVRLAAKASVAGAAQYPSAGEPLVHVRGGLTQPGEIEYQVAYRNAAMFCTPGTSNTSNALRVLWGF